MILRTIYSLLVVSLLLPLPVAASALPHASQEATTATPQEGAAPPPAPEQGAALQPIEEGEIPSRAELVEAELRRIEALILPAPEIARVESTLGAREVEIISLRGVLDAVDPAKVSGRRLGDLRLPWLQLESELAAWSVTVRRRFNTLQEERERLREVRAKWELTAREAEVEEFASELQQRIEVLLSRVLDVEARVRERRNAVGAVAGRISSRQELVSDSLYRIDDLAAIVRGRLLARDASPMWQALGAAGDQPFVGEAAESGLDWARSLLRYLSLSSRRLLFLGVSFFLLLIGTLHLQRQASGWPSEYDGSERFRKLIGRPFSLATAFSLVATLLLLPYPVGSAADVLLLLAIVPILRLGAAVLSPTALRRLYGVAALLLLARVATLGPDVSLASRLLLSVVGALGSLGGLRAVMRGRKQARESSVWARVVGALILAASGVLGAALVANVFGWVQLSEMLIEATMGSLFAAYGWAILLAAVAALLPPVIGARLGDQLPSLRRKQADVVRISVGIVGIVASVVWLHSTLIRFQVWEPLRRYGASIAASELSIGGLSISTGGFFGALVIILGTWLIAQLVRFVLHEEVMPRLHLRRGTGQSLVTLANYAVYAVGIIMAASAMGLTGTQLAVVVGALSLGIGFGLQNIVNNFVSGLILIFERPIKVGDTVQTIDHWGKVQHIGIRASIIRSFDGAEIVVPNGDLIAKEVINWTRTDEIRRAEVTVGVAYGTDPEAVLEILRRVAEEHPLVRAHPKTKAQMIRFGESSLDFHLRCWTKIDDWLDVVSDLHVAINRELKAAGITIPFPQRDLHIKPEPGDPDLPPAPESAE